MTPLEMFAVKTLLKKFIKILVLLGFLLLIALFLITMLILTPLLSIMNVVGNVVIPKAGPSMIPPEQDLVYFLEASQKYNDVPPWYILASTNYVESGYGRNKLVQEGLANFAGAMGPMQFIPTTFEMYKVISVGININSEKDSVFATANMYNQNILQDGGWPNGLPKAIFAYNHANWYVNEIEQDALYIQTHTPQSELNQAEQEANYVPNQNATAKSKSK